MNFILKLLVALILATVTIIMLPYAVLIGVFMLEMLK